MKTVFCYALTFHVTVSLEDNLYVMSKPIFWEKIEKKIFQNIIFVEVKNIYNNIVVFNVLNIVLTTLIKL